MANEEKKPDAMDVDEFRALIKAADAGKPDALKKLREYLDQNDWAVRVGDLSILVMDSLMGKMVPNPANREMLGKAVAERKRELGYPDATGVERMLIERIAMCWLRLIRAESYCNNIGDTVTSINEGEFAERSLSRAHSRFLRACEALERYRLLAQATKMAKARADLLDAKAGEARMNKSNAAMRLLKSATG